MRSQARKLFSLGCIALCSCSAENAEQQAHDQVGGVSVVEHSMGAEDGQADAASPSSGGKLDSASSAFSANFTQREDSPDVFSASLPRTVMNDAKVRYVLRDDGFCWATTEQEQESQDRFSVNVHSETHRIESSHELAWQYLRDNREVVEASLREGVWAKCHANFLEFRANVEAALADPDTEPQECEWESMKKFDWTDPTALDRQVNLYAIDLFEQRDGVAFCAFNFDIGWDEEHGLCVVMHRDKVLAVNGAGDFRF